jgi:hypothetical protein
LDEIFGLEIKQHGLVVVDKEPKAYGFSGGGVGPDYDVAFGDFALLRFEHFHEAQLQTFLSHAHMLQVAVFCRVKDAVFGHLDVDEIPAVFAA